jgi:hypothetical protein
MRKAGSAPFRRTTFFVFAILVVFAIPTLMRAICLCADEAAAIHVRASISDNSDTASGAGAKEKRALIRIHGRITARLTGAAIAGAEVE